MSLEKLSLKEKSRAQSFGGTTRFYAHRSIACDCEMNLVVYVPPQAEADSVPVLYYLSGLTCTEKNFIEKAGAQRYAAEHGLILVAPDTSPRGTDIPGEDDDWDFGSGAGFYVNATVDPWAQHYQMYDYVTKELPELISAELPVRSGPAGIFGHSMGGHGALICGLKNPEQYASISAFAPIAAPSQCPWGKKAFTGYFGEKSDKWAAYDATELVKVGRDSRAPILIDQGEADPFLAAGQLMPEVFKSACEQAGQPITLRRQPGYDHSYYFISTFMGDHIRHHANILNSN
ncbi:S-formylglutathione hydrolase [Synechococcus sp. PCC 7335]|uniref:S-formylglutathione hydrolase n=1 Tax=Synechococcus sp. (strain ATCC 29403 / PCC 7335) TaxID=91464 RepID=UPI00017EBFF6|nr:S-formylglutathione hydrolase [Synechococcus sp. PCC 7335]EDX83743.1 S-formylglutathione hydrolase [Synechococcus sp. PCC 7335]